MIFPDTNFLVFALSRGTAADQKLRGLYLAKETVGVSSIVWAEFLCGPVTPEHVKRASTLFPSPEAFTAEDGVRAAELFNGTGRRRGSLAAFDYFAASGIIDSRQIQLESGNP
jgi:predicted nucleic acid-binding protein